MKILIDFDGTCVPKIPHHGFTEVDTGAERVLKMLLASGHQLYLWTCRNSSRNNPWNYIRKKFRTESSLSEAERWFSEREIPLSGINEVPGEEDLIGYARKPLADFVIDDTSVCMPLVYGEVQYIDFETGEISTCPAHCVDWSEVERILRARKLITV